MSTDVGTWTNWLTFEPDPDYSPDAGTGLLSPLSYKPCYVTSGKSDVYVLVAAATRGFTMVSFTEAASRGNTFVGGTRALPSALLVSCGSGKNMKPKSKTLLTARVFNLVGLDVQICAK